ncbi:hypothetical protein M3J09_011404 [Ascochyta lentis]
MSPEPGRSVEATHPTGTFSICISDQNMRREMPNARPIHQPEAPASEAGVPAGAVPCTLCTLYRDMAIRPLPLLAR